MAASDVYASHPVRGNMPEMKAVSGTFFADPAKTGSADPCPKITGKGYTAFRSGTGVYRVIPNKPGMRVFAGHGNCALATPAARFVQNKTISPGGASQTSGGTNFEFVVVDASGAATDLTSSDSISFTIWVMERRFPKV